MDIRIDDAFSDAYESFVQFANVLHEIYDTAEKLKKNQFYESMQFFDLKEDEDQLLKRLARLKAKAVSIKNEILIQLSVLNRILSNHIMHTTKITKYNLDRSLIDILQQNIIAETEFESIQRISKDILTYEEAGFGDIEKAKLNLNIAIQKLNKKNEVKLMLISEARAAAWTEMKDAEFKYRKGGAK